MRAELRSRNRAWLSESLARSLPSFPQSFWVKQTGLRNERRQRKARGAESCLHPELSNREILKTVHLGAFVRKLLKRRECCDPGFRAAPGADTVFVIIVLFPRKVLTIGLKHFPGDVAALEWGPGRDKEPWGLLCVSRTFCYKKKKKSNGSFLV